MLALALATDAERDSENPQTRPDWRRRRDAGRVSRNGLACAGLCSYECVWGGLHPHSTNSHTVCMYLPGLPRQRKPIGSRVHRASQPLSVPLSAEWYVPFDEGTARSPFISPSACLCRSITTVNQTPPPTAAELGLTVSDGGTARPAKDGSSRAGLRDNRSQNTIQHGRMGSNGGIHRTLPPTLGARPRSRLGMLTRESEEATETRTENPSLTSPSRAEGRSRRPS